MKNNTELIVMLTHNDHTVKNACEIFEQCNSAKAKLWGFKESGLSLDLMKKLSSQMKKSGKTTVLEVVAYSEKDCINGARMAAECNCDVLMGTLFFDSVNEFCQLNNLKYMPFIGKVENRPSVLSGDVGDMIAEAKEYLKKGVYGFDLLGYRYTNDSLELINRFVHEIDAPVCVAGSINSYERLDEIMSAAPWAFTVGGAFFENRFGETFCEQINKVYDYVNKG